jgi:thiol-disulfide isomerase/thioredoxin
MKKTLIHISLGIALHGLIIAGPAQEIAKKHAAASATELEAYLKTNPNAEDKNDAVELLLMAYDMTGNTKSSAALLQEKFNALGSGADVEARNLFMTTRALFELLKEEGNKKGAQKLLADANKKCAGNEAAAQLAQAFSQMESSLKAPSKGETMDLKFTSLQGKSIDLDAMKGKVILVDFWATWCGPCIAELPNVINAYNKYHSKGFEVIGISLDKAEDKAKLQSFIKDKKMPWPQHFDGLGWANKFAKKYGISGIPATYLIGTDGKIVATNLRGAALEEAVKKHIAK